MHLNSNHEDVESSDHLHEAPHFLLMSASSSLRFHAISFHTMPDLTWLHKDCSLVM